MIRNVGQNLFPTGLEFAACQVSTSTNTSAQITPTANVNQLYRLHNRTANRLSFAIGQTQLPHKQHLVL